MASSSVRENILFTGGRSPVTLDLIRQFAKAGYNVFVAECIKNNVSGRSKFAKKNILIPSPATDTEDFIQSIIDIVKEYKISTLVPTCEEVFYVAKYKSRLEKYCNVFTSSIDVLSQLHSKYNFIEMLKTLEIPSPESSLIKSAEQLNAELANKTEFVLKPEFSRFASLVIINDKSPEKLRHIKISNETPWVLQQFIKGKAFCSYSVAQNGKVMGHSIYPSIFCAGQGATIHFENVDVPEIDDIVNKIVKHLNYTGQIAFDFIQSEIDGKYYPIECNPRATSGIYLFSEKDNLPSAFMADNQANSVVRANPEKSKMIALAMVIYELPKVRSFAEGKEFFSKMLSSQDVVFKFKDLKPFVSQFTSMSHYSSEAKKKNITLMQATTLDIEWNGN